MRFPVLDLLSRGPAHGYVLKHDLERGTTEEWDPGAGRTCGEAVFVPRAGASGEDDGWLLTYAHDAADASSDLLVLPADDHGSGPVASVHLPQRVPAGFHGLWSPAGEVSPRG